MCFFHGISISQELKCLEGTDAALFQDHTWLLEALKELEKKNKCKDLKLKYKLKDQLIFSDLAIINQQSTYKLSNPK